MKPTTPKTSMKGSSVPRCLGIKAAAALIGVPPSTLKTYVAKGYLPRIKLPGLRGRVLLRERDLIDLINRYLEPAVADLQDELRRAETAPRRPRRFGEKGRKHLASPSEPANEHTPPEEGGPE